MDNVTGPPTGGELVRAVLALLDPVVFAPPLLHHFLPVPVPRPRPHPGLRPHQPQLCAGHVQRARHRPCGVCLLEGDHTFQTR